MRIKLIYVFVLLLVVIMVISYFFFAFDARERSEPTYGDSSTAQTKIEQYTMPFEENASSPRETRVNTPDSPGPGQVVATLLWKSGDSLQNALVTASLRSMKGGLEQTLEEETDDAGHMILDGLPLGKFYLSVNTESGSAFTTISLSNFRPVCRVVMVLDQYLAISGVVLSAQEQPIQGAKVSPLQHEKALVLDAAARMSTTDENGRFTVQPLEGGLWRLDVQAGAEGFTITEPLPAGSEDVVVTLGAGYTISGKCVDDVSGKPLAGVGISAHPHNVAIPPVEVSSGDSGLFQFIGMPSGWYRVLVNSPSLILKEGTMELNVQSASVGGIELRLVEAGGLRGHVVLLDNGRGLPYVPVTAFPAEPWFAESSTVSLLDGSFEIMGLAPSGYRLKLGNIEGFQQILNAGAPTQVRVAAGQILAGIQLYVSRGLSIAGKVVDAERKPVPGAAIRASAHGWQAQQVTGIRGDFVFAGIPSDSDVELRARAEDMESKSRSPVHIGNDSVDGIEIQLTETCNALISGIVVDQRNRPITGAQVTPIKKPTADPPAASDSTNSTGEFLLTGLVAGTYELYVGLEDPAGRLLMTTVNLNAGQQIHGLRLKFDREGEFTITGETSDKEGRPLSAILALKRVEGGLQDLDTVTRSGIDGSFEFSNLRQGSYAIEARAKGYLTTTIGNFEAGTSGIELILEPEPRIAGYVQEENGAPVAVFQVAIVSAAQEVGQNAGEAYQTFSDPGGYFMLSAPATEGLGGEFDLVVRSDGHVPSRMPLLLAGDGSHVQDLVVVLSLGSPVLGQVVNAEGQPVAGAAIVVSRTSVTKPEFDLNRAMCFTSSDGTFEISPSQLEGDIIVRAFHSQLGASDAISVPAHLEGSITLLIP